MTRFSIRQTLQRQLLIFAFFMGLAALALNRLILHLHEWVAGGNDIFVDYHHAYWNYWWIRKALTTPGLEVYHTNYVLFPYDNNLAFHTLAPFWFPLWALLEPVTNAFVAMNTILWLGLALTGYVTYLFLREQGIDHRPALVGGALMALLPHFINGAGQSLPVYVAGFWLSIPFMLWSRVHKTGKLGWAVALGIVFWLMLMTDLSLLLYMPFILLPYALYTLYQTPRLRLILLGIVPFVVLLALGWFIAPLRPMLDFDRDNLSPAALEATKRFSMPLEGFWQGGGQHFGLGLVFTGLTLLSIVTPSKDRERWLWLAIGTMPILLCLGPDVTILGVEIPLPYRLLHEISGGVFRMVMRFAPAGVLMWLVFIGRTWTPRLRGYSLRQQSLIAALLVVAVLLDLRTLQPFQARPPVPAYHLYEDIGKEPYDILVVNVPISVSSGWIIHGNFSEAEFYALTHGKRTINGLIARVPDWTYEFFLHDPTIGWLGGFHPLEPDTVRAQLAEYAELWDMGYIAVHQNYLNPAVGQAEEIIGFLNSLDYLCPVTVERDVVLYRTSAHPDFDQCPPRRLPEVAPGAYEIDFGMPGDELFIGQGFHRQEIIGGPSARWLGAQGSPETTVYIDLPPSAYTLTLEATAFNEARKVRLLAGETEIGTFEVQPIGYQTFTFDLPAELVGVGEPFALRLQTSGAISAEEAGLSGDPRPLSIALNWMRFAPPESADRPESG
jgi:hypothetical protein